MNKQIYPEWIDDYAKIIYKLVQTHDTRSHMPFNGFNFYPLFDDLWVDKIYQAVRKFNNSDLTIKEVINKLPTHSSMKFNLLELFIDFKTANTDPKKAKFIIDFFMQVIHERADVGNLWKDTRIKDYADVDKVIKEKQFIKPSKEQAQEVAKIIAGCGALVHGLYNDFCTDFGYDTFGPYDISTKYRKEHSLFVRQFIDLKPVDIWPKFNSFPYKTIRTYTVYKNVESEAYYLGSHTVYKQSLVDNLTHFQVEIDNKFVNKLDELKEIRNKILEVASWHYAKYKTLKFEEHKRIWLWQLCYQFKDFFEKVGIDWRPSKKMLWRVKEKRLVDYISRYDISFEEFSNKFGINYLKQIYSH